MKTTDFAERLGSRLAAARVQLANSGAGEQQAMQERSERLAILEREGERLHREVIRPRITSLASGLDGTVEHYRSPNGYHSYLRCPRTARFPASARLGLGLEWTADGTDAWLTCNVEIIPVLMALPGDGRLPLRWDGPSLDEAAEWVEQRIMQFLEACLDITRDPAYHQDRLRSDPVCGMRVSQDLAACTEYDGKRYYFCSASCQERFMSQPKLYGEGRVSVGDL